MASAAAPPLPHHFTATATAAASATTGSRTLTETTPSTSSDTDPPGGRSPDGTLRLRGAHTRGAEPGRRIRWDESVVDNEGLGRKKSKACCIYHAPRAVGESSAEDDSSSSDSDSSTASAGAARPTRRSDSHNHDGPCDEPPGGNGKGKAKARKGKRRQSPNAYEKMPKRKPAKSEA
ncbi:MAG: Type 1 phosphatases regulator ypi1 [Thelocarpon impressellum]|nr:MAG: Type 1 phosphatases regulator ypi1 [Thelocarpon impressellum]